MVEIPPGHAAHALGATTTRRRGDERKAAGAQPIDGLL